MHDWPQDVCVQMLANIRKAMTPGYSKVIINECVVPERGATKFMTTQDLNMMSVGGGVERTHALHQEYIESAGLKITGVWSPNDQISESVIELDIA
jgi:demethylsterigmatocystin 6-O-methyltransferase